MKDKIAGFFANAGCLVWQVLYFCVVTFPLIVIDLPKIIECVLLAVAIFASSFFSLISFPLWVWGFVNMVKGPQDVFAIVYYVLFGLVAIPTLFRTIIQLIFGRR